MANIEEKTRKVLGGLLHCGLETQDACNGCPYEEYTNDVCIPNLCRDAYSVITTLDTTINAMMGNYADACDVDGCPPEGGEG